MKTLLAMGLATGLLALTAAAQPVARTFTVLHSFMGYSSATYTNLDGIFPGGWMALSGNTLYGTTLEGPDKDFGSIFSIKTDGAGFTNIFRFNQETQGAGPANLILEGNTLYGTCPFGGFSNRGTLFAIRTDGAGFVTLHTFISTFEGYTSWAPLLLVNDQLYGTTTAGGRNGTGTIFTIRTNGSGFTILYHFPASIYGGYQRGGLVQKGQFLYGLSTHGGANENGYVYALKTNGAGFTNLYNFSATANPSYTNSDGSEPNYGLTIAGETLYGGTFRGGPNAQGTLFKLQSDGSGFTVLHGFSAIQAPYYTNSDGRNLYCTLKVSGNTLYGTTLGGGPNGSGTIFTIDTNGGNFALLSGFSRTFPDSNGNYTNSTGGGPMGQLTLAGSTLYGCGQGGSSGNGTIFSLSLAPPLDIRRAGSIFILSWPVNYAGLDFSGLKLQVTHGWRFMNATSTNGWVDCPPAVSFNGKNFTTSPANEPFGLFRFY